MQAADVGSASALQSIFTPPVQLLRDGHVSGDLTECPLKICYPADRNRERAGGGDADGG